MKERKNDPDAFLKFITLRGKKQFFHLEKGVILSCSFKSEKKFLTGFIFLEISCQSFPCVHSIASTRGNLSPHLSYKFLICFNFSKVGGRVVG